MCFNDRSILYDAFSPKNLISAFEATGLSPFNPEKGLSKCHKKDFDEENVQITADDTEDISVDVDHEDNSKCFNMENSVSRITHDYNDNKSFEREGNNSSLEILADIFEKIRLPDKPM